MALAAANHSLGWKPVKDLNQRGMAGRVLDAVMEWVIARQSLNAAMYLGMMRRALGVTMEQDMVGEHSGVNKC
ncbi:hypothetical protein ACFQ3W_19385 [Paenibacillus puldeungensis]|uniref:Uncharacterized protein n=1 Tax=Paenibacillus puldeungensis TaxID=696536 RepID=A0ABW3S104_9BACL